MIRAFILVFFLILTLQARQNPFFPSDGEVDIPFSSNIKTSLEPLKRATLSIPSNARVIKKVTVEYINLDGSTSLSTIKLNNSIDWYLPIFISQSMGTLESSSSNKKQTKHKAKKTKKYIKLLNLGFATFYKKDKEFKIVTNDFMIRDFLLTSPHRIVMDFQRDLSMKSQVKNLDSRYYKKISFGVHKDYYRIVLELDGIYKYKKEKQKNGHSLFLY